MEYNDNDPVVQPAPTVTILRVTSRQREALTALSEDDLIRFQLAFNALVNLITEGNA